MQNCTKKTKIPETVRPQKVNCVIARNHCKYKVAYLNHFFLLSAFNVGFFVQHLKHVFLKHVGYIVITVPFKYHLTHFPVS